MFVSLVPLVTVVAMTGSSVSPPVPTMNSRMPLLWIVIPGGVKGAVVGIEVVVSVQHQVGFVLVEQLPKGLSGNALWGDAVRGAERGLMPVGGCARGMILLEILFQPCEFGGKPGARWSLDSRPAASSTLY